MKFAILFAVPMLAVNLSGCATLKNGATQAVNIKTQPPGAICDVEYKLTKILPAHYSEDRKTWSSPQLDTESRPSIAASIVTPGIVVLNRDTDYSVRGHLLGYTDAIGQITPKLVDWDLLIVGNLFVFGLIPGVIVDTINGAANHLTPAILEMPMAQLEKL